MSRVPSEREAEIIGADSWPVIPNEGVFGPRKGKVKKLWHEIKLWLNLIDRCAVTVVVIYRLAGKTAEYMNLQDVLPSCHQSNLQCWLDTFVLFPEKCWFQSEYLPNTWLNLSGNVTSSEDFKLHSYIQMWRACTGHAVKVRTCWWGP